MEKEFWYRITNRTQSTGWDEWKEIGYGHKEMLTLWAMPVISHTPKGVWLDDVGEKKFVLRDARKRYAYPTREEALEGFKARKKRQIELVKVRLNSARASVRP